MGGGESKMESAKVKLQAMSAMQAKMEKLETDLAHKDRALEYERRLVAAHADVGEELRMEINELSKPKPVAKKKHKKRTNQLSCSSHKIQTMTVGARPQGCSLRSLAPEFRKL